GAALAASDEAMAWFCHGLEEILRAGQRSEDASRKALAELTRWRGVLAEMIVAPERALETLRLLARAGRPAPASSPLTAPRRAPPSAPSSGRLPEPSSEGEPRPSVLEDATLRVPSATLDR